MMSTNSSDGSSGSNSYLQGNAVADQDDGFTCTSNNENLFDGIVPEIMKVCESLTHSSTPHHETATTTKIYEQQQQQQQQHYDQEQESIPFGYHSVKVGMPKSSFSSTPIDFHQDHYDNNIMEQHHHHHQPQIENEPSESNAITTEAVTVSSMPANSSNRKRVRVDGQQQQTQKLQLQQQQLHKRYAWSEDIHREFVGAVFDIGMKNSSPSSILDQMVKSSEDITSERIKSHLQKYRLNKDKSKKEYMQSYDAALATFKARGVPQLSATRNLSAGAVAAYLTYVSTGTTAAIISSSGSIATSFHPNDNDIDGDTDDIKNSHKPAFNNSNNIKEENNKNNGESIISNTNNDTKSKASLGLPRLTEEERRSPLGSAFGYITGLLFTLRQQLMQQRHNKNGGGQLQQQQQHQHHASSSSSSLICPPPSEVVLATRQPQQQQYQKEGEEYTRELPTLTPLQGGDSNYYSYGELDFNQPFGDVALLENGMANTAAAVSVGSNRQQQHTRVMSNSNNPSLEESQKMKLEMRDQISLQNKMRELKQKEIQKYQPNDEQEEQDVPNPVTSSTNMMLPEPTPFDQDDGATTQQRPRAHSETAVLMNDEFFWSHDMVDEQLFEFLMSAGDT